MQQSLILASGSLTRRELLTNAGVSFDVRLPDFDEAHIKSQMTARSRSGEDIARALASAKATQVGLQHKTALVLGCDQVLELEGHLLSKPRDPSEARDHLARMSGRSHRLISAAAIAEQGNVTWHTLGTVTLTMHKTSSAYREDYVRRNWNSIRHSVGAYKLEEEGARLFQAIEGDYFNVLGMPLIEILDYLVGRGIVAR